MRKFTEQEIARAKAYSAQIPPDDIDPKIEALVNDLIGRVADKWTMLLLEILAEKGELRFTRLSELVDGISQKMLTQTLRQMERMGWSRELCIQLCRRGWNTNSHSSVWASARLFVGFGFGRRKTSSRSNRPAATSTAEPPPFRRHGRP